MKVLLLNSTYEPIKFISERKAIKHLVNGKVECVSTWPEPFKYGGDYCLMCGNNLEFYSPQRVKYRETHFALCTTQCAQEFKKNPKKHLMPAILRLKKYAPLHIKQRRYNRGGIFKRDKYRCMYCGEIFPPSQLTIDHVTPRAMGGKTSWRNCVTCCHPCNNRKGDRTPKMAGMQLLYKPTQPPRAIWYDYTIMTHKHEDWEHYIIKF